MHSGHRKTLHSAKHTENKNIAEVCVGVVLRCRPPDGSLLGFASLGNVKISDLDFADDGAILLETLDVLVEALEALNEESELLGR